MTPKKRKDWHNRYGAGLREIKLIEPPISLGSIKKRIPELTWANYPRSITTPSEEIAEKVRALIARRRKTGMPDIDEKTLLEANIEELRKVALLKSKKTATKKEKKVIYRARSMAIKFYVLKRSKGYCEGCRQYGPFKKSDGTPYLEPHHTKKLSDDGPDHPKHVIALCPNCHRRAHYAVDANSFNARLIKWLAGIEKE